MLEFKVIENLKPNKDLTDILKDYTFCLFVRKHMRSILIFLET